MGIYLMPPLMSPFSTIETIIEENRDITESAEIENILKFFGSTTTSVNLKGMPETRCVATAIFVMKFDIIINKEYEREKSNGAIIITITAINII